MSPEKTFTALVVGLGAIGLGLDLTSSEDHIFTHVKALLRHERFRLVAGVDPDPERRREFQDFTGAPAYGSVPQASQTLGRVDLVVIATPTQVRQTVVVSGLALTPRLMLLEKPLAATLEEAQEIYRLCEGQGVLLAVNYFRFFAPGLQRILDLTRDHDFGSFRGAVCHYSGGLLSNASHFVSWLIQWFGTPREAEALGLPAPLGNGEVNLAFRLDFQQGTAWFVPHQEAYSIGELDLFFSRGRVLFKNYGEEVDVLISAPDPFFSGYQRLLPLSPPPPGPDLQRYQYDVLTGLALALDAGSPDSLNACNALETLRVCLKVYDAT